MPHTHQALSAEDIDHFTTKGHVVVKNCFDRAFAQEWIDLAYQRLGYHPDDPQTWTEQKVHLPSMNRIPIRELAPKVWNAICDLTGSAERIAGEAPSWGDGFICNFNLRADQPWQPPSPQVPGWFVHYLDGPEQGLLTIVVWSEIKPQSGGTFIACDSVPVIARHLHAHPEGLMPNQFSDLIEQCSDFAELTGETGDVVLLHPFVLHAASQNPSSRPRFITNPCVSLKEPLDFNRPDPADFSPIEQAVLNGLGVERLDYQITGARKRLTPERERRQKQMLGEQQKRLEAAHART